MSMDCRGIQNPYEVKDTANEILKELKAADLNKIIYKNFYDI